VAYSRVLVGISSKGVEQFNKLTPPPSKKKAFNEYVAAQEEVREWDRDALRAAEEENATAYLEAREKRDNTEAERQQLAEAVGFHVCGNSEA
jgi:regulator of protease activity HflC (stomatin/prohibitin superfamily)